MNIMILEYLILSLLHALSHSKNTVKYSSNKIIMWNPLSA